HAQLDDLRNPHVARLPDDADREERRCEVANHRNQADDRIEADAIVRPRHDEGGIQQIRDSTKRGQPLLLTGRQRPEPYNFLSPHRISTVPTVKPAPTDATRSKSPSLSRFCSTASLSASGIVPAVVLPKRS